MVAGVMRNRVGSATGRSPYQILFGRSMSTPLQATIKMAYRAEMEQLQKILEEKEVEEAGHKQAVAFPAAKQMDEEVDKGNKTQRERGKTMAESCGRKERQCSIGTKLLHTNSLQDGLGLERSRKWSVNIWLNWKVASRGIRNKSQTKQKIWKSLKIGWLLIGILILVNAIFWWIELITSANIAILLVLSVFLGYSIIALICYVAVTILFLLIKLLMKIGGKK